MKLKNYFNILRKSYLPDKRWIPIIIAEVLFFVLIYYLGLFFVQSMEKIVQGLSTVNLNRLQLVTSAELADANIVILKSVLAKFYSFIAISFLVFIVIYTLFNLFIWSKIGRKSLSFDFIKRYLYTALPIKVIILLVFMGMFKTYQSQDIGQYFLILSFVVFHILTAMHIALLRARSVKSAYKLTGKFAFEKFHYFIIPYIIGIVVLFVLVNLVGLLTEQIPVLTIKIQIAVFIIFITWWRIYILNCINKYVP